MVITKRLKVLITACGCPGASTLIRMLKNNGEREIEIIGVDMDNYAIGRFISDNFYVIPAASSEKFIPRMLEIVEKEKPDILFPESSYEVYPLACNRKKFEDLGTKVLVSEPDSILKASNKWLMYETLKNSKVDLPKYYLAESLTEFIKYATKLGFPDHPIVFKPPVGKGSRGVRIIDPKVSYKYRLLELKPEAKYISLDEFSNIFKDTDFPKLLVMEYLGDYECTTDCLCLDGEELLTTVKTVERTRWGVITLGTLIKNPKLVEQTREILKFISLSYCVNLQFINEKLTEINPRVSTFIYQPNLIQPYLAIKLALGEITSHEVKSYNNRIEYGRKMVRYMDQVSFT